MTSLWSKLTHKFVKLLYLCKFFYSYLRSINFKANKTGGKIIAEEIIEEIKDETSLPSEAKKLKVSMPSLLAPQAHTSKSKAFPIKASTLVKRKTPLVLPKSNPPTAKVSSAAASAPTSKSENEKPAENKNGGLSLLSSYASSSEESGWQTTKWEKLVLICFIILGNICLHGFRNKDERNKW